LKNWIVKRLGGYTTVEDALMSAETLEDKHKVLTKAVAHHFILITKDDIIKKQGNEYTFKGKPLLDAQVQSLRSQAEGWLESTLFEVVDYELKHQAYKKIFENAENEMDVIAGKLILWNWDVVKSKLKNL